MNLPALAHALGGTVAGRNRVTCPGPGHSRLDRSLGVLFGPSAPDGFVVHSYAGDDPMACKDHVRRLLGMPASNAASSRPVIPRVATPVSDFDRRRSDGALAVWSKGRPLTGTPAEGYLRSRGLDLADLDVSYALRWHPDCGLGGKRTGCMIALVRDILTDEKKAIHRTAIDPDGNKTGRMALGPVGGGAVKFTPDEDVTLAVAIGEGIETCLSLRKLSDLATLPIWSVLSASQVARFPVLPGIETLWLAVDHDPAGIAAAETARIRWQEADREVITISPTLAGADLNDLAKGPTHA